MRIPTLIFTGLLGALVWLILLVATEFSSVVVAIGLLGVVRMTGRSD